MKVINLYYSCKQVRLYEYKCISRRIIGRISFFLCIAGIYTKSQNILSGPVPMHPHILMHLHEYIRLPNNDVNSNLSLIEASRRIFAPQFSFSAKKETQKRTYDVLHCAKKRYTILFLTKRR